MDIRPLDVVKLGKSKVNQLLLEFLEAYGCFRLEKLVENIEIDMNKV